MTVPSGFTPTWKSSLNLWVLHLKFESNRTLTSKVRVRVEHIFGAQSNDMVGTLVRSIGLVRAKARIGLKNLSFNMRRLVQLERLVTAFP